MIKRVLFLILCAFNLRQGNRCRLNTRIHFAEPQPIIIKDGRLLEPTDSEGNVDLNYGDTLILSCEGAGTIIHPNMREQTPTIIITCEDGDMFKNDEILSGPSQFSLFRCLDPPNHTSRRTNRSCFNNNPIYEVGYYVNGRFYALYESCFNEAGLNVVYSKYTQKPYNAFFQTRVNRPYFIANDVYGFVPVDSLFSPRGQKAAVTQLVGPIVDNYITKTELLSRGHLAAKTDFVYAFSERATFHYVNCAPQWTGLNGGNWNTLEVDLRNHVHAMSYDTIIYTGTYGVSQLMNQFERRVDIYLYSDENNNPVIPVPLYFYKVVYDASKKAGTAFVGINNPYYTLAEARELFFCPDVCRENRDFSWLTWHPDNPHEGYTFCCTIQDFSVTIRHLPQLDVNRLLT